MQPIYWDERRQLIVPGDYEVTLIFCIEHFMSTYREAIKNHGSFFVALSGGSTPKAMFERLCQPPYASRIDWAKVYLFWSDERSVSPSDPESNYHMAMEAGFKKMPIPPSHIFRMPAEDNIEENAHIYEKTIREVLQNRPFDLVMLGMGDDGHTASLFPHTEGLKAKKEFVIANFIPQKNTWRMSFTYEGIHHSKHIVFYVLGAAKKYILAKVLKASATEFETLPSAKVGDKDYPALWIVDEAAAALVIDQINPSKKP